MCVREREREKKSCCHIKLKNEKWVSVSYINKQQNRFHCTTCTIKIKNEKWVSVSYNIKPLSHTLTTFGLDIKDSTRTETTSAAKGNLTRGCAAVLYT